MGAQIIDGRKLAKELRLSIKQQIESRLTHGHRAPCLVVIQVGTDPASTVYIQKKHEACVEVGIVSHIHSLPVETSETDLTELVEKLNFSDDTDGILIQLPLPKHINSDNLLERIRPEKDVDGFHPFNLGRLAQRRPLLRPCTPYGIIKLLNHIHFPFKESHVALVGVSNIVGRPMGLELLLAGSTVTLCHRFTKNLPSILQQVDCVIVAIGQPAFIQGSWLKPGCVVIDVGISRLPNGELSGDIDFESAQKVAGWITPVPGGVGPMTVATLLENTLRASTGNLS